MIPTDGKSISAAYWSFMNLWDADIIYSYVALTEELENRIVRLFAPSEVRLHDGLMQHEDASGFRPDYTGNFEFLSCLSVLAFFAKRSQVTGDGLPDILDKEAGVTVDRDLADSFGFVAKANCFHSLLPYARRVSLATKLDSATTRHAKHPVSYVEDADDLIDMIAKRRDLLTLSRLSDMFCPHLHALAYSRKGWDNHMSIVIGDEVADRLLFWNAQHRYSALRGMDDIPTLRLSPARFENGVPEWLKDWISRRNHRHLNGNAAPQVVFRSCSLTKKQLDEIGGPLGDARMVMLSTVPHGDPCVFDASNSTDQKMPKEFGEWPPTWAHSAEEKHTTIHFENNEFDLPLISPWHIRNVPASGLTSGIWAVDLCIERAEDHCPYSNKHHIWKWPRRLRLEQALDYVSGCPSLVLPPRIRPTECGDLTVWDGCSWSRSTLRLPRDYQAFALAVERFVPASAEQRKAVEADGPRARFEVTVSDKGRDLLGVFQFFQSLPEALGFLTDDFWCDVIKRLSPEEPANNRKSMNDLAQRIRDSMDESPQGGMDAQRLARCALALAARTITSHKELSKPITFDTFLTWAKECRKQQPVKDMRRRLTKSVVYLRDRGFLWQGYAWRCSFCQHRNWIALDQLSPIVNCEICRKPQSSPVSGSLHFRLSPFVQHAFSSTSAQGAVIWCLGELARRATRSFAFAPSLDLYRPHQSSPETDIDLLAVVDEQVYLVEVKSSFAGVQGGVFKQLERVARELQPDVVMFAVMESDKNGETTAAILRQLETQLDIPDIRHELLTLDKASNAGLDFPLGVQMDKTMKWSIW